MGKFYKVSYNNNKTFATGREISFLQQSGVNVKKLRKATKEEYDKQEAIHADR
jgi:hypothetical protein